MSFLGLMNKQYIHKPMTLTEDASGAQVESYSTGGTYLCRLDVYRGGRDAIPESIRTRVTNTMFAEPNSALTEKDRVEIGGVNFGVLLVGDQGGKGHHTEVYLERCTEGNQ